MSKLFAALWRWGRKKKESLQLRLWNLNVCIEKVDVKCWLEEMTLTSNDVITLGMCFSMFVYIRFVADLRPLAEIWQLSQWRATGELEVEFKIPEI